MTALERPRVSRLFPGSGRNARFHVRRRARYSAIQSGGLAAANERVSGLEMGADGQVAPGGRRIAAKGRYFYHHKSAIGLIYRIPDTCQPAK